MSKPSRREFLSAAAAGAAGLAIPSIAPAGSHRPLGTAKSCIFINMVGGPAHLDTFDPKPDAPADVRGPFRPIRTKVPGIHLSELFPKLAKLTDKFSLIRSMHHDAPPIHECGFQLLNTGRLFRDGPERPSAGAVVSFLKGDTKETTFPPRHCVLPESEVETGIRIGRGFGPGYLGDRVPFFYGGVGWTEQLFAMQDLKGGFELNPRYGMTAFGQNCAGCPESLVRFPGRFLT